MVHALAVHEGFLSSANSVMISEKSYSYSFLIVDKLP